MKKLPLLLFFIAATSCQTYAAYYTTIWPSGNWIYSQSVTEQNYDMSGHQQRVTASLQGPTGYNSASTPFQSGTVSATAWLPYADGTFYASGTHEVYCTISSHVWTGGNTSRSDRFGTSWICVRKSLPTCSTNPTTGWVTCSYYPVSPCNVNCAAGTAVVVVGASNEYYEYKKRWRVTPAGLDCYGSFDFVSNSCSSCRQQFDF